MNVHIGDHVRVSLIVNGIEYVFLGIVTGIQVATVIIQPDAWEQWMNDYYNPAVDPEGRLSVNITNVVAVIP